MHDLNTIFSQAIHAHQQGQFQRAKSRYLEVLAALPDNVSVLGNLGILCRDLGELEEALRYCRQAAEAAPEDPAQQVNLGAIYEPLGHGDLARKCYEQALALSPEHPKALNNLGKILHQEGETDRARQLLERAVAVDPDAPLALNNLGVLLGASGESRPAIALIEKSLRLAPDNIEALYNLAGLYNCEGDYDRATALLERLLSLAPDHAAASHMLAALSGRVTETAPADYVAETFDRYAGHFDNHIQDVLGYSAPTDLAGMLHNIAPKRRFRHCLDLGCGTGLSGTAFRPLADKLTGVDLSARMLDFAERKEIYHRLECMEILQFLEEEYQAGKCYDLFVAADVFIYIGDLDPFFQRLAPLASPGAVLACSTERTTNSDAYTLRVSGRYAHNRQYLVSRAKAAGFQVMSHAKQGIRRENGSWIPGDLLLFARM